MCMATTRLNFVNSELSKNVLAFIIKVITMSVCPSVVCENVINIVEVAIVHCTMYMYCFGVLSYFIEI